MTKITVNFKEESSKILNHLAKLGNCALSTIVERLINESLTLREDVVSATIIKAREKEQYQRLIPHKLPINDKFKLFMLPIIAEEDMLSISKPMQKKIEDTLPALIREPMSIGSIMNVNNKAFFRFKIEDCRIFYAVDLEKHRVTILAIKHRKDLFEDF